MPPAVGVSTLAAAPAASDPEPASAVAPAAPRHEGTRGGRSPGSSVRRDPRRPGWPRGRRWWWWWKCLPAWVVLPFRWLHTADRGEAPDTRGAAIPLYGPARDRFRTGHRSHSQPPGSAGPDGHGSVEYSFTRDPFRRSCRPPRKRRGRPARPKAEASRNVQATPTGRRRARARYGENLTGRRSRAGELVPIRTGGCWPRRSRSSAAPPL